MAFKKFLVLIFFLSLSPALFAGPSPLAQVKTDDPRDTMRTFLDAMIAYKKGVETRNERLESRINDAVRTMDLSKLNAVTREDQGKQAALYLKEVIDRALLINYDYIPTANSEELVNKGYRWRMKDTEITIRRVESGDRKGEYLFTADTVARVKVWYDKTKHLPYVKGLPKKSQGTGYREPWLQKVIPKWAKKNTFLTLAYWQWIGIGVSILLGLVVIFMVRLTLKLARKLTSKTSSTWDNKLVNAISGPTGYLAASGFWYVSLHVLRFQDTALLVFSIMVKVFFSFALIWLLYRVSAVLADYLEYLASKTENTLDDQLVPLFNRIIKILIISVGVLFSLQNLGVNVFSVMAGLGIGGLAFALAAKDTVANFFGSLMILLDRPFQVGDWVLISKQAEGTVEEIGFRSTRVRTFYNSVISVPNADVANAEIDNMGQRMYRRVNKTLGLTYDTPPEKVEAFVEGVKNIIKANPKTRKDYFHVVFRNYGNSSLDIMIYFFLKVGDWSEELVETQNVFLEILRLARDIEVEFAFPTQTLHIDSFPEKQPRVHEHKLNDVVLKEIPKDFGKNGKRAKPGGLGIFYPPYKENTGSKVGGDEDG